MKKYIGLLILTTIVSNNVLKAQNNDTTKQTISSGWGNLDYSVPEAPAFKILGSNPSTILKPTSTKEIAVSLGNYYLSNGPIIPKNLAVEISPALLSNNLNLQKYNKNKFWYRTSLSLGTNFNNNGTYDFGVGLRFTIADKTDIRTDANVTRQFIDIANIILPTKDEISQQIDDEETSMTLSEVDNALQNANDPNHARLQKKFDDLFKHKIDSLRKQSDNSLYTKISKIDEIRKAFKDSSWNKKIIQFGIAGLFPSKDSLAKNLSSLSKAGLWVSGVF
jgi:hypothetical protein